MSGDVYVADLLTVPPSGVAERVQEFTPEGRFVLEIGKEVNEKTKAKGNLCTEEEIEKAGVKCTTPGLSTEINAGSAPGAFNFVAFAGDLLAVGGPEDLLYVGDEHRVQEFKGDGQFKREIREPLEKISATPQSKVFAVAVDPAGDVYLAYKAGVFTGGEYTTGVTGVVREFGPAGDEVKSFEATPREAGANKNNFISINGMALDVEGHLALSEDEEAILPGHTEYVGELFGSVYEAVGGRRLTRFSIGASSGIAFDDTGGLYAVVRHEVVAYAPLPVVGLVAGPPRATRE